MPQITQNKPVMTAGLMVVITLGLIALEIYVDIHTGIENATTPYQKNVMGWMGALLGAFSAISVMASGALKKLGKHTAFLALGFLSLLLAIYSLIVWISFFCTMWTDYSTKHIENSVEHQAKVATVEALKKDAIIIDASKSGSAHVIELNNIAAAEELAIKNCNNLKADSGQRNRWNKITNCKNKHGAIFEKANRELGEIATARESNQNRIDSLKSISVDSNNSLTDFVMMPLAAVMAESKQDGKNLMLAIAVLITVIVSYITNAGLYFVGSLLGDDYINNHHFQSQSPTPQPMQNPRTMSPESWRDRYRRGDVSLASAVFGRNSNQQPAQTTANADVNIGDFADAINRRNAVTANAINQISERGRGEFRQFDDAIIPTEVNTTSPTLMVGVGFAAREVPNPNYQAARPPVIHWQQENPSGVEIELEDPDTEEITPPLL